jgi:hypothetical protein
MADAWRERGRKKNLYCRHVSLWHRQRTTWLLANHASFGPYPSYLSSLL